jgi:hypothetical protein
MLRLSRLALAAAGIALASAGLLTGCATPASEPVASTETASREAAPRGSRLCILNETKKTFPLVRERGPFDNGDHQADPPGPLAPGKTWCTSGYNSYSANGSFDATAEIQFTRDGSEQVYWAVDNPWLTDPVISWGSALGGGFVSRYDTFDGNPWETDEVYPKDAQPNHDYHIRRLDDSEFFKEWLVTVRR